MTSPQTVKQCCASLYESDLAKLLLGESFHPGGAKLTERLGTLLALTPESLVFDVASGRGASAFVLAERFGCRVVGVDYSERNVDEASRAAKHKGLDAQIRFLRGDAERLPVDGASFDAIVCECAFCTFPDKQAAAREFARVLRPGGVVGLSDLTRGDDLPADLNSLLAWIACIADAQPAARYAAYLSDAGLRVTCTEDHDEALVELVNKVRLRLLGAEIAVGLRKIELPGFDFASAKRLAQSALQAIQQGELGYAIVCGRKA